MRGNETQLSLTGRRWRWPEPIGETLRRTDLPGWLEALLARRGVVGEDAVGRYLEPSLKTLDDPAQMAGMAEATERLALAVGRGETIAVFGDYDVDGVCSTTILVDFLQRVGANVTYYIPDRRAEGYGLNAEAVRELAGRAQVLITTDCGITAHAEIALGVSLGLDVIVVDHHTVPAELPAAIACLDPHRSDCAYPFKGLCAAGVAFMLVVGLRRHLRDAGAFTDRPEPDLRELLDVLAVATVADMVPIEGHNRTFVAAGLRRMALGQRPGLRALIEVSGIDRNRVTASDLGFRLGPRINARGRLSHAKEAVEMLLTRDPARAMELAEALDAANRERQLLERETVERACERVEAEGLDAHAGLVLYDAGWHPGVLGLVASRLVSRYHRPAVVIGEGGKGSGRSIEGLNLYQAMAAGEEHLLKFGGHPAAAGLTIEADRVPAFAAAFEAAVREQKGPPPYVPTLEPDLEVTPTDLSMRMVQALERLAPFGQKNPEPLLVSRAMRVTDKRVVKGGHLKLRLGDERLDAIAFRLGDLADDLPERLDVAFRLERNVFRGQENLQLRVEDLRSAC